MYLVNILTKSEAGLAVDADIIRAALPSPEFMVNIVYINKSLPERLRQLIRTFWLKLSSPGRKVINLHCEQISERYLSPKDLNVLIPNQEWAPAGTLRLMSRMDAIFYKTRYAVDIYQKSGPTMFIGFDSPNRLDTNIVKDYNQFLHLAGKSSQKGTRTLATVWSRHPEWPALNLVSRRKGLLDGLDLVNINKLDNLSPEQLKQLQNRCGVHLCPSEAEGYGHSICEGMSTGALILTTDAPPMREIIEPSRGVLVAFNRKSEQGLGCNYYVDETALEQAISQIISMEPETRKVMATNARQWFVDNQQAFTRRLQEALKSLASPAFTNDRREGKIEAIDK